MPRRSGGGGGGRAGSGEQQRTTTYDLSAPRNLAAFQALLAEDEDEEAADRRAAQRSSRKAEARQQQQKARREKERFFKLRDDAGAAAAPPAGAEEAALAQLRELFGGAVEPGVLSDVLQATGGSCEAAVDALLAMLGSGGGSGSSGGGSGSSGGGSGSSRQAADGASSSSAAAAAAAAPARDVCWSDLPADVRLAVLARLPAHELARAAPTCREFRGRAAAMRAQVRHLLLQPALSYGGLVGMVAGHAAAGVLDFSRWERHIARLRADDLPPQVAAMHRADAEASLFRGVIAAAEGARCSSRTAPVSGLVLRGLVGTTDRLLAEALQSLGGLRSLDVSHCPSLTNKSLYLLAKYKATTLQQQPDDDASEGEGSLSYWPSSASSTSASSASSEAGDAADLDGEPQAGEEPPAAETGSRSSSSSSSSSSEDDAPGTPPGAARTHVQAASADADADAAGAAEAETAAGSLAAELACNLGAGGAADSGLASALARRVEALQLRSSQQAAAAAATAAAAAQAAAALGLQELRLCGGRAFADDGLRSLLHSPVSKHSLAKLDVSGCKGFTSAGLVVPPLGVLRELRACRCSGLTQLVLHLPASHPLGLLDLSGCHYLRKVDLALAGLASLNLSACRTLYRLRLRCPVLESCVLAQCGLLHDFHADAWQVPALRELNLFGCRRAAGYQLQAVLASLQELRRLNINGCWGIQTLHLTGNLQLEGADLTGCRNLLAFSCSSTQLTQLTAASCARLQSLTLASTQLRQLQLTNCSRLGEVHVAASGSSGGSSGTAAGAQARARNGGSRGTSLQLNGCTALPPAARARLAAAVAS